MVVMLIIQMFGCVSGAHLNPVVTLAAIVYDMISIQVIFFRNKNIKLIAFSERITYILAPFCHSFRWLAYILLRNF